MPETPPAVNMIEMSNSPPGVNMVGLSDNKRGVNIIEITDFQSAAYMIERSDSAASTNKMETRDPQPVTNMIEILDSRPAVNMTDIGESMPAVGSSPVADIQQLRNGVDLKMEKSSRKGSSGSSRANNKVHNIQIVQQNNGNKINNIQLAQNNDYLNNKERSLVVWYGPDGEKPWSTSPSPELSQEDGMAPARERRLSRGSIHPGGATPHIKDAFGPRTQNSSREWAGTPIPDAVSIPEFKSFDQSEDISLPPEDSSGGLPHLEKNADRDNLFFRDGKRRIDLVIVYEEDDIDVGVLTEIETLRLDTRRQFHKNLEREGLELELEPKQVSYDQKTYFLKIHVPWMVLTRYAEVMNLKMPIKSFKRLFRADSPPKSGSPKLYEVRKHPPRFLSISVKAWEGEEQMVPEPEPYTFPLAKIFELDTIQEEPSFYTATFSKDREEQFVVKDRETFFTSAQRSQIAFQILLRTKYDDDKKIGIRRLLNNGTYLSVFPLHEGSYERDAADGVRFDRRILYLEWARIGRWYKKQPLWLIRKYFGDKIALYFAWLGFYTEMLIAPAIVGLLCFFYGITSMDSSDNIPSKEICDHRGPGNITLCPLCDKVCRYQKLYNSCVFSRITYLFDNPATVFFAIFMSFWATTFLELWKRRQAVIAWEWDLQNTEEDEEPRPEFESTVHTFRINPVTRRKEPFMPPMQKAWKFVITVSTVFFMILVVCAAVLGTIIYRISVVTVIYEGGNTFVKRNAKIFTAITGALINLIIIMILTRFYHFLAIWLTNQENPRTQTEYEDSYTFKIYFFEFMNYYSSLIYIAFFKGRFFSYPGDQEFRNSEIMRIKGDVCDPAGCLFELCIQLAIIMVGKQFFNNFLELAYPAMLNWWRRRTHKSNTKDLTRPYTRWEEDYQLQDPGRLALFEEYLEMVLQYGFVTLFVAAFPLAPLFALLNNIWEIRLDAFKMVAQSRRPLAERVEDIGAWYGILQGVTYCAVVSNAFVIAYTSDYIPRMVYKLVYSETRDLVGYIDSSLSVFNTSDYTSDMGADKDEEDDDEPELCQYRGYRNGPDDPRDPYGLSPQYWHVFAARLAFVVIFEHIVFALTGIMAYTIPDVPSEIRTQIQRERLLAKEAKYEHGAEVKSGAEEDGYDEILTALRESHNTSRLSDVIKKGSRRQSRGQEEEEQHKKATINTSTVWEVP